MKDNFFEATFFIENRKRLADLLPNSVVILTAHNLLQFSADIAFPFRQDASFWYLTGLDEPDLLLFMDTTSGETVVLLPKQNDYQTAWDGGHDTSFYYSQSGIQKYKPIDWLESAIKKSLKESQQICSLAPLENRVEPYGFIANPARRDLYSLLKNFGAESIVDIRSSLARLRAVKQPKEIEAISQAITITDKSLKKVRASVQKYKTESDIERDLTVEFYRNGADGHAYEPIVASAANASIIHYNKNRDKIAKNSLLLLDVGARYAGYCADISRTWAIQQPTERQTAIYEEVKCLQDRAINQLRAGVLLRDYQKTMETYANEALIRLNAKDAGEPYPHGFSHFLGLDVHDAGLYDEPLPVGAVITVEPGLYLKSEGIGVRIEDNVLITEDGIVNLSKNISRELVY